MQNAHQILIIVVDTRILSCVADSLQECRFASISPTDYKYAKVSIFFSEVIGIKVAHGGKESGVGTLPLSVFVPPRKVPSLAAFDNLVHRYLDSCNLL